MLHIQYYEMLLEFKRILCKTGFDNSDSELCAKIFTESSLDGVYTHGVNRFMRFINSITKGNVDIYGKPECVSALGSLECWDGNRGPGNLNAYQCMARAVTLAGQNGIGCIALRNSNHWMRGGTYGLLAADSGCVGICWSNTIPIMPPWGSTDARIGNNPIVFSVPRKEGHVLLDMALSLYSYGKMESYARSGQQLPFEAGWDKDGMPSRNPKEILDNKSPFPIGFWKGSGLSIVLDLIGVLLSAGKSTYEIGLQKKETRITQTFIAINAASFAENSSVIKSINDVLGDIHNASLHEGSEGVFYPGERMLMTRNNNKENGIPVDEQIWNEIIHA